MANKQTNANGVITPLIIAGIYYYFFNLLLSLLFRFIEKKLNYYRSKEGAVMVMLRVENLSKI